jgi:hypothetical protein
MKKIAFITFFIACTMVLHAQDTPEMSNTKEKNAVDSAETTLLHGEYNYISTNFAFSKFTEKNRHFCVHGSGFFVGFSNLSTRNLKIADVPDAILKYSSYEIGWTVVGMDAQLSRKYGWLLFAGVGFRIQQYNSDLNTAFKIVDGKTIQAEAPTGIFYSTSKLTQWYVHVPIMLEYQKGEFFIQAGMECGIKLSSKSKVKYRIEGKKMKEKTGTGMNVNPLTVDAKVEIGFYDFALYAKYGLLNLFRKNRGAEVIPVSAGLIYHF